MRLLPAFNPRRREGVWRSTGRSERAKPRAKSTQRIIYLVFRLYHNGHCYCDMALTR